MGSDSDMGRVGRRVGIMLCYPLEEKRLNRWTSPIVGIQPKLDGLRARVRDVEGKLTLFSSEGNVIHTMPHILATLERHSTLRSFDGELYVHGVPLENILSVVHSTVNRSSEAHLIQYHIFDSPSALGFKERYETLMANSHFPPYAPVCLVPTHYYEKRMEEVLLSLDQWVGEGYEGVIIRDPDAPYEERRSTGVMKFKPKRSDTYRVIGWNEEISIEGTEKGALGSLTLVDDMGTEFNVGSGFTRAQREELWKRKEDLVGRFATIHYQHTTKYGIPRCAIFAAISTRG